MKSVVYNFNTSTGFKCYDEQLSESKNLYLYGLWSTNEGLGCNFRVGFEVEGPVEENLYKKAADSIDHMFLNKDISYFKGKAVTPECVAEFLFFEASKELEKKALYLTAFPSEAIYINAKEITLIKKHQFLSRVMQVYLSSPLSKMSESDRVIDRGLLRELLEAAEEKASAHFSEGRDFSELCEIYFNELKSCAKAIGIKSQLGFVCFYDKNLFYSFGEVSPVITKI